MLHSDRTDITEAIDVAKSNNSKECMVCHYLYFFRRFKFQSSVCNDCHDLTMLCPGLKDVAIITVRGVDYHCVIYDVSKSKAIHLLENSILENCGYI